MKDFSNHRNRKKIARLRRTRNLLTVLAVLLAVSIVAVYFLTAPFGARADAPRIFPAQRFILPGREQAEETAQTTAVSSEPPVVTEAVKPSTSGHSSGAPRTDSVPAPAETTSATTETSMPDTTTAAESQPDSGNTPGADIASPPDMPDNSGNQDIEGSTPNNSEDQTPENNTPGNADKGSDNLSPDNGDKAPGDSTTDNGSKTQGNSAPDDGDKASGSPAPDDGDKASGSPAPNDSDKASGSPAPDGGDKASGSPAPKDGDRASGSPAPDGGDKASGSPIPDDGSKAPGDSVPDSNGKGSSAEAGSSGVSSSDSSPSGAQEPVSPEGASDLENADALSQDGDAPDSKNVLTGSDARDTPPSILWITVFIALTVLLGADIIFIIVLDFRIHSLAHEVLPESGSGGSSGTMETVALKDDPCNSASVSTDPAGIQIANLQHIGARPRQEDSSGVSRLSDGVIAIVADGMGGLAGGDLVSQKIVYTMLECSSKLAPGQMDGVLPGMVTYVTETINSMIGEDNYYKMGSTLLAVLVRNNRFHWITVGDSHIYLFRDGTLIQLNQEHNRGQDLLLQAVHGEISFSEARNASKKSGLTSFIGMGKLRCVDRSLQQIPLQAGDRIMLCTDGIFNTLPDKGLEAILRSCPDIQQAADQIQQTILRRNHPKQDNFTAVILGF